MNKSIIWYQIVLLVLIPNPAFAGLLPWENWIYHVDEKKELVQNLQVKLVNHKNIIQSDIVDFNVELANYRSVVARNQALGIIGQVISMNDEKYRNFTIEIVEAEDHNSAYAAWAEIIGIPVLFKMCKYVALSLKKMKFPASLRGNRIAPLDAEQASEAAVEAGMAESAAEAENALADEAVGADVGADEAIAVIEETSLGALGSVGIGLFAAVGVDLIIGLIDGAVERDELDEAIGKLQAAEKKVNFYVTRLQNQLDDLKPKIKSEADRFVELVRALELVTNQAANFTYDFKLTDGNFEVFSIAQQKALIQFGEFVSLRHAYNRMHENHPKTTEKDFKRAYSIISNLSEDKIGEYLEVLRDFSAEFGVSFYAKNNMKGDAITIGPGQYTPDELEEYGLRGLTIRSINIPERYEVDVWQEDAKKYVELTRSSHRRDFPLNIKYLKIRVKKHSDDFFTRQDAKIQSSQLEERHGVGFERCAQICTKTRGCSSFVWNRKNRHCVTHDSHSNFLRNAQEALGYISAVKENASMVINYKNNTMINGPTIAQHLDLSFKECASKCFYDDHGKSQQCRAFNYMAWDGTCEFKEGSFADTTVAFPFRAGQMNLLL